MEQKAVKKLEREIEDAITKVIKKLDLEQAAMLPSRHTVHLMSKAAVTVYEAAVENMTSGD